MSAAMSRDGGWHWHHWNLSALYARQGGAQSAGLWGRGVWPDVPPAVTPAPVAVLLPRRPTKDEVKLTGCLRLLLGGGLT
jgi:hypothetical protein